MSSLSATSRRAFLRTSALAAAGTALPAWAASEPDFTFAVVTDLHYRDARCGQWSQRVLASLRAVRPRPAFVMLGGDLAEDGSRAQLGAVREIFGALPIPVRQVIGNHDYALDGSRAAFEEIFGRERNRRFEVRGCQFLALDSTQGRSVYRTRIPAETVAWMEAQLPSLSAERPLIVLTHFPLGRNWLRPVNARQIRDPLRSHRFLATLSGHWHGLTEREEKGVHLSTGRCCSWWRHNHDGSEEKGYVICSVRDGGVSRRFVAV